MTNQKLLDFTKVLVDKYAAYFSGKADIFNIGLMNMPTMPQMPMAGRFSKPASIGPVAAIQKKAMKIHPICWADLAAIVKNTR